MSPTSRVCHRCSARLEPGARFCEGCGTEVMVDAPAVAPAHAPPLDAHSYAPPPVGRPQGAESPSRGPIIAAIAAGIVILGGGSFAAIFLTRGRDAAVLPNTVTSVVTETVPAADTTSSVTPTTTTTSLDRMFDPAAVRAGRCFTRGTHSDAFLIINGSRYGSDFIQCGAPHAGYASGEYDLALPPVDGTIVSARIDGLIVVDESTSKPADATVSVSVNGTSVCRARGSYGSPGSLSCDLPADGLVGARISIDQTVRPNSHGIYAGLLHPRITITSMTSAPREG